MIFDNFSVLPLPSYVGSNVEPYKENDIESVMVKSDIGYVPVGCFVRKNGNFINILNEQSSNTDIFGFVLPTNSTKKRDLMVINNECVATVLRYDSPLKVQPLIVNHDNYVATAKVIKTSSDMNKYPVGAIILASEDTENFSTINLDGRLIIIQEDY